MRLSAKEVLKFRDALTSIARIQGLSLETIADGHEAELVEVVVIKVLSVLKMMYINQLPSIVRSVCLNILEKKRRESECQVLLVFDDQDIESGFADYLKVSLECAKIRVFSIDDLALLGKETAQEIRNATEKCSICVVIVTKNFDSSYSFLETIAQIFESKKTNGQKICPCFLNVKPSHVRHISLHEKHKYLEGGSRSTYEQALKALASCRGWASDNIANGKQGELVKQIVKDVWSSLNNP